MFSLLLRRQNNLSARGFQPLAQRRQRRNFFSCQQRIALTEQPWISQRAAADHDGIRAGCLQNIHGLLRAVHIAVGNDRNRHGALDLRNGIPIRFACIHLRPRASVQRDGCRARRLRHLGEVQIILAVCIPALAEFDGHRHIDGLYHRADNFFRQLGLTHQRTAVTALDNLRRRTAHIDVQQLRTGNIQCFLGAVRHIRRIAAENLHPARLFRRCQRQQLPRLFVLKQQGLCGDHLTDGCRRAALPTNLPKRPIRHTCHRRHDKPSVHVHLSNTKPCHMISPAICSIRYIQYQCSIVSQI